MRRKIFITLSAVIALIAVVATVTVSSFAAGFKKGNYYILDEELFSRARSGENTVYCAYEDGELVEVFDTSSIIGRDWVALEEVGDNLINGFLSAEDREFYNHRGINVKRTIGALFNYIFHITSSFGASTITQQVVKNISGDNESTASRKFNEIMRALHLERLYTKDEILEVYLNIVPMSGNIYGVLTAAETYFGKQPCELTVAEAATVVGITNSPGRYDPYTNPDACTAKRDRVLYAMLDNRVITEDEYKQATEEPLGVIERQSDGKIYSWFVETANRDILNDLVAQKNISYGAAKLLLKGSRIILTEDPKIQRILDSYFSNPDNFSEQINNGLNYAMVVTDNLTGNLVGIVGGVGEKKGNNLLNLAEIPVPPASTFKPLAIYAPMIDEGLINWATVIDDTPLYLKESASGESVGYPVNSPNVYSGLTSISDAVRLSKNTVAVKLLENYGYEKCAEGLTRRYGFDIVTKTEKVNGRAVNDLGVAPLALGQLSRGVSVRKLTEAYSTFAREGQLKHSTSYFGVFDFNGNVIVVPNDTAKQIYRVETCRVINQMLMGVVDNGTAKSITLKHLVDTAGKTGTSSGNYDRLFVGYTPYYTAGIWCGYPSRGNAVNGVSPSHIKVWDDVMCEIHNSCVFKQSAEPLSFSIKGLVYSPYCIDSGCLHTEVCDADLRGKRVAYGYFLADSLPTRECEVHRYVGEGKTFSAPAIDRTLFDNVFVADEEYNYYNLEDVGGFENSE